MYNIGDLAACKSLTKLLNQELNNVIEYPIFENEVIDEEFKKIRGAVFLNNIPVPNKYTMMFTILYPKLVKILSYIYPKIKKKYSTLLDSYFILFSPGGLELGLYQEWKYLWLMSILTAFDKQYGIYSRSIGDFKNNTFRDYIFKKYTIKNLKKSKFNGLRDLRSQKEAEQNSIPFYPSIDVVFSNVPDYKDFSVENTFETSGNNYIVFTPSAFAWHPRFSAYSSKTFVDIYLQIINTIIEKSDSNIVMLPHIYKDDIDTNYFNSLKSKCINPNRVFVLKSNPNTDLYQFIISKARFAILSRLHQTIFSINNHTPFLSISYEHKMEEMLKLIGLENYSVKLQDILDNKIDICELTTHVLNNRLDKNIIIKAQKKANNIALNSFDYFTHILYTIK